MTTNTAASPNEPIAKESAAITWGPLAAVIGTLAIYFSAQFLVGALVLGYASLQGISGDAGKAWSEGTGVQFIYIFLVEATTLGLLWQFLRHRHTSFRTLGLIKPKWRDLGYTLVGFGMYFPLLLIITAAAQKLFPTLDMNQQQQIGFEAARGFKALAIVFISLAILPPFTEEVLIRGFLYLGLKVRMQRRWAAIVTSLIFALAHLQFGSGAPLLWSAALDTFVLSLVLIYLREETGGLWASIGLHTLKNSIAFVALFLAK